MKRRRSKATSKAFAPPRLVMSAPADEGVMVIRPRLSGVRQEPPLPVSVELTPGAKVEGLADRIRARVRDKLLVTTEITLVARAFSRAANMSPNSFEKSKEESDGKGSGAGCASHHGGRR